MVLLRYAGTFWCCPSQHQNLFSGFSCFGWSPTATPLRQAGPGGTGENTCEVIKVRVETSVPMSLTNGVWEGVCSQAPWGAQ